MTFPVSLPVTLPGGDGKRLLTIVEKSRWLLFVPYRKERMMRVKRRNAWTSTLIASAAILTATAGITGAASATAAVPSRPLTNVKTCTFAHGHLGPTNIAIDAYTDRKLAWTHNVNKVGATGDLQPYKDTLNQCWHLQYGFGNGYFEIRPFYKVTMCLTTNPKHHSSGFPLVFEACLSRKTQLFYAYGSVSNLRIELVRYPSLCIGADAKIKAGAKLYQETCRSKDNLERWWINYNP
jgi:hypothetical protein